MAKAVRKLGWTLAGQALPHEALHRFGIGPTGALLVRPDGSSPGRAEATRQRDAEEMHRVLGVATGS